MADPPLRVLYDRDCGFCRWSVAKLLELDSEGALDPVAIQSPLGNQLLAAIPQERRLASAHAVTADGAVLSGGDAAPAIASCLPGGDAPARLTGALPGLTRVGYRLVAGNRRLLGRFVSAAARARADTLLAERTRPGNG